MFASKASYIIASGLHILQQDQVSDTTAAAAELLVRCGCGALRAGMKPDIRRGRQCATEEVV